MFKDLNDTDLRAAYWATRTALYNAGALANAVTTRRSRVAVARPVGRLLRDLDIITGVARKRSLDLIAPSVTS